MKKILIIITKVIFAFVLLIVFLLGSFYFTYNEELPMGKEGLAADLLANKMLKALDHEAYKETNYIAWTFKGIHKYQWYKNENRCTVHWEDITVQLDLKSNKKSTVSRKGKPYSGEDKKKLIAKALAYFNNDSFWLVAPYKVFDSGVERRIVEQENGRDALLITYTTGGTTPGDSYLWHLNEQGVPTSYQMWVQIIPIGGIHASWEQWTTTESGAKFPSLHKLIFLDLEMGSIQGLK